MRGSIVVLALAVTPFIASTSQAQHGRPVRSHVVRREMPALHRDNDNRRDNDSRRGIDKKCDSWHRGNPSQNGMDHRADPRKSDSDCDVQQPPTQSPPPPPPAPAPAPDPAPAPAPDPAPDPAPAPLGHTVITGSVFFDIDQDGMLGPDEVAESGWTVQLTGPMNLTTTTDGSGSYTFSGLIAGTYKVCVVPPMGWVQTPIANAPSCGTNLYGYSIDGVQLAGDVEYSGVDFGFISQ
jgi:hypothetical protein